MIKIAFVIPELNYGGAQTMLVRLAKSIDKTKFDIAVFVRDSRMNNSLEAELEESGIKTIYLDINENTVHKFKLWHKVKSYKHFSKKINEFNPDVLHVHLELFYSLLYAVFNNKKIIHTIHSQPERISSKRLKFFFKMLTKKKLLTLVGCAKCVSDKMVKMWSANHICTVYNPIDISEYSCADRNEAHPFSYIHVARMNPIKNQKLLITAFKAVTEESPNSRLVMVGDGSLTQELKSLTFDLGIADKVEFLGNRSDIPQLLSNADAFVLSSDSECCPMTVLEAIASGLPVVSTDVGGIGEISGDAGLLVEKGNLQQLAEAMIEVQTNKEKYCSMKNAAIEASRKFDAKHISSKYEELYIKVNTK